MAAEGGGGLWVKEALLTLDGSPLMAFLSIADPMGYGLKTPGAGPTRLEI